MGYRIVRTMAKTVMWGWVQVASNQSSLGTIVQPLCTIVHAIVRMDEYELFGENSNTEKSLLAVLPGLRR